MEDVAELRCGLGSAFEVGDAVPVRLVALFEFADPVEDFSLELVLVSVFRGLDSSLFGEELGAVLPVGAGQGGEAEAEDGAHRALDPGDPITGHSPGIFRLSQLAHCVPDLLGVGRGVPKVLDEQPVMSEEKMDEIRHNRR